MTKANDERKTVELGYTRVADEMRRMILSNELKSGDWIRVQPMAERLGVSSQPVREALQLLQGEGLLTLIPNRGAQVFGLTKARLQHIYEVRAALESFASRRFAEHASFLDMLELESIQGRHDRAVDSRDYDEVLRANRDFHEFINGHSKNDELLGQINRYYALARMVRSKVGFDDAYLDRVKAEHHELLVAFRQHDATAAAAVGLRHAIDAQADVLRSFDGSSKPVE